MAWLGLVLLMLLLLLRGRDHIEGRRAVLGRVRRVLPLRHGRVVAIGILLLRLCVALRRRRAAASTTVGVRCLGWTAVLRLRWVRH